MALGAVPLLATTVSVTLLPAEAPPLYVTAPVLVLYVNNVSVAPDAPVPVQTGVSVIGWVPPLVVTLNEVWEVPPHGGPPASLAAAG